MSIEDLRRTLHDHAEEAPGSGRVTASQRTAAVLRRARAVQRRRAVGTTTLAACAAAAVVAVLAPHVPGERAVSPAAPSPTATAGTPTTAPEDSATPTPATQDRTKAGWRYPETLVVRGETYVFGTSYEMAPGRRTLRMEVDMDPSAPRRALAWSTSPSAEGQVTVTVDGEEVARDTAGSLVSGELLPTGRSSVVVVRAPRLAADEQIALAVYEPQ